MNKLLTVIIPSYNVDKYLNEILPTYVSEKLDGKIEVIVVSDGSKDNTVKIATEFEQKYPNTFKVVDKENGGHGSTINAGIKIATGLYTKVVDGDDWVDTEQLEQLIGFIESNQGNYDVILNPHVRVYEGSDKKEIISTDKIIVNTEYKIDDVINDIERIYQLHGINIKTEILRRIPAITENCFYVDQQYVVYPLKYINNIIYLDLPVYQYRIGTSEQSMSMKNQQKNLHMLVTVVKSLIEYSQGIDDKIKRQFIDDKIIKMSEKICKVNMSFGLKSGTYKNWKDFLKTIQKENFINVSLDTQKLLYVGKIKFYILAVIYNAKLRLEKRI